MKRSILILFLSFASASLFSQQLNYNTKKGYIAKGYDVVSYFVDEKPREGKKKFQTGFEGVKFKFSSEKNLHLFAKNPMNYIPQYGGYCAYAIGKSGEKVSINPKTYEIREGKLYLFYNAWGTNTLKMWINEGASNLKKKADNNWEKIKKSDK